MSDLMGHHPHAPRSSSLGPLQVLEPSRNGICSGSPTFDRLLPNQYPVLYDTARSTLLHLHSHSHPPTTLPRSTSFFLFPFPLSLSLLLSRLRVRIIHQSLSCTSDSRTASKMRACAARLATRRPRPAPGSRNTVFRSHRQRATATRQLQTSSLSGRRLSSRTLSEASISKVPARIALPAVFAAGQRRPASVATASVENGAPWVTPGETLGGHRC